jgi:hypothetical protein
MMVPAMRVMVMVLWYDVRLRRHGFGRRIALVLLRGAHRTHRQFEAPIALDVGCRGHGGDDDGKGYGRDQERSATRHDAHVEISREVLITPS